MGESIKDQMENFNEEGRDTLSIPIPFAVSPRSPVYKTRGINYARVVEDVGLLGILGGVCRPVFL